MFIVCPKNRIISFIHSINTHRNKPVGWSIRNGIVHHFLICSDCKTTPRLQWKSIMSFGTIFLCFNFKHIVTHRPFNIANCVCLTITFVFVHATTTTMHLFLITRTRSTKCNRIFNWTHITI